MANVKVMLTNGKDVDILKEYPEALRLHLISKSEVTDQAYSVGDYVTNERHENMYALITRNELSEKNLSEAIRLGIIQLFKHLIEEDKKPEVILMKYFNIGSYKAKDIFVCILKELMITYFGEAFTEDITLVICECTKENLTIVKF